MRTSFYLPLLYPQFQTLCAYWHSIYWVNDFSQSLIPARTCPRCQGELQLLTSLLPFTARSLGSVPNFSRSLRMNALQSGLSGPLLWKCSLSSTTSSLQQLRPMNACFLSSWPICSNNDWILLPRKSPSQVSMPVLSPGSLPTLQAIPAHSPLLLTC